MGNILILIGNPKTIKICGKLIAQYKYDTIKIFDCDHLPSTDVLTDIISLHAPNVIISRGSRAKEIAKIYNDKIVDIPITAIAFLKALKNMVGKYESAGVVGHQDTLEGLEDFESVLNIKLNKYLIDNFYDVNEKMEAALADGGMCLLAGDPCFHH